MAIETNKNTELNPEAKFKLCRMNMTIWRKDQTPVTEDYWDQLVKSMAEYLDEAGYSLAGTTKPGNS